MRFPEAPKHCKMHDGCNFRGTCANCAFVPRILRNGLPPAPLVSSRWRSLGLAGLCEIVRSRVGGYANESPTPGSARWGWRASGHIALHDPTKGTGTAGVSRRTGRKRKRPAIAGEPWESQNLPTTSGGYKNTTIICAVVNARLHSHSPTNSTTTCGLSGSVGRSSDRSMPESDRSAS